MQISTPNVDMSGLLLKVCCVFLWGTLVLVGLSGISLCSAPTVGGSFFILPLWLTLDFGVSEGSDVDFL